MIYKTQTDISLDTIESQIQDRAKEFGFGVLGSYKFKEILLKKGFELDRDITVYELCNPASAHSALSVVPEISVYLPCRISLYEEDGKSVLATIGVEDILHSVKVDADFKKHMTEIFSKLQTLMHSW